MTANGTPRRRTPARRALVGGARIVALLAVIIGVGGILAPQLTSRPAFYAVAVLFAVVSFALLRGRPSAGQPAAAGAPTEPSVIVDEAKIAAAREDERERWSREVANAVDAVRRTKQELAASEESRAGLKTNLDDLTKTVLALRQEITKKNETANQQIARADARVAGLNNELLAARNAIDELKTEHAQRADQLQKGAAQRESEWSDQLRKSLEGAKADSQREIAQRESRINELQRALESERGVREEVATLARELQQQLAAAAAAKGDLKQSFDRELGRIAELEAQITALTDQHEQQLTAHENEWNDKVRNIVGGMTADHETEIARVAGEREEARARLQALTARMHDLEQQLGARQHEIGELKGSIDAERASATTRVAELQQQLDARAAELDDERTAAANRLQELDRQRAGDARTSAQRIEALEQRLTSDAQTASARVEELEQQLAARESEWNDKLQKIVTGMAADHENDVGAAIEQRESARAEARASAKRAGQLEEQLAAKETEWNEKLQKIVAGMAADHESDVGQATVEREAARAEVRHLTSRVHELQRQLDEGRANTVDEAALRAKIDTEWSEKLQTIVSHLASDHDEDIGKALEQKEEAKAEVRTLNLKVNALQKQVENDKQMFLAAEEKWNTLRDALKREIEDLKSRATPPPRAVEAEPFQTARLPTPEPFPSPFGSALAEDAQRARAEVLEIAEQAHAVLKRTAPGTIPIPHLGPRPLILFVHHDPTMRTMWRDQLHKHGYDVITAADGLEGLRLASAQRPGVVIADVQMPKMDGRELCQLIKSNEQTANTKVILMSGLSTVEMSREGFHADEMLRKPVKFEALQTALNNLIGVPQ